MKEFKPHYERINTKKLLGDALAALINVFEMKKKYEEMNDETKREWLAKEINKVQHYLDWLGKESRKYATAKIGRKKIDSERPDLEILKSEK